VARAENAYLQHNLVSDVPGLADHTNASLVNAWGIGYLPGGPWWVNAADRGKSFVFDAAGNGFPTANPLVVNVPNVPTGIAGNTSMDFQVAPAQPALFLFATEDGNIAGWNPNVNLNNAVVMVPNAPASYKGITLGMIAGHNVIYAANFAAGTVDVFGADFKPVTLSMGAFHDSSVPIGFSPFNVQSLGSRIAVTFAKRDPVTGDDVAGPGNGYVVLFTPDGTPVTRLEHGKWFSSPWGVTMAPADFGSASGRILVGQFGSGQIATFEAGSGEFAGLLKAPRGKPVQIDGLWGLKFGNGGIAGPMNVLFFAAGIQGEEHGLFGSLSASKENGDDDNGGNDDRQ
jgi:uncharacterized protein (TIGR03118 family)